MILHIPHSSTHIPTEVRSTLVLDDAEIETEILAMTDAFTEELFALFGTVRVVYPVSRLVVDPERFCNDADEPMAKVGMGAVYMRTSGGNSLRNTLTPAQREQLLAMYYRPHHQNLEEAVEQELKHLGNAMLLDCHSFPSKPLPCDKNQGPNRPDFCIGTDECHTPPILVEQICDVVRDAGHTIGVNEPYSGTLVPMRFYRKDHRVWSVMIEVRRDLYMNESKGAKAFRFGRTQSLVRTIARTAEKYQSDRRED